MLARAFHRGGQDPPQQLLIKPEPDLRPLRDWILNRLSRRPERWQDLHTAVRPEWWLPKHTFLAGGLEPRRILFCG
jgi:hypothetical protein